MKERAVKILLKTCDYIFYGVLLVAGGIGVAKLLYEIAEHPYRTITVVVAALTVIGGARSVYRLEKYMDTL